MIDAPKDAPIRYVYKEVWPKVSLEQLGKQSDL